jgi:hypothetical protein
MQDNSTPQMTTQEITTYIQDHLEHSAESTLAVIEIPDEIFWTITREQAKEIAEHFSGAVFVRLPASERKFFEWLRNEEESVWNDLWESDFPDEHERTPPYLVSIGILPEMVYEGRGFPICDLSTQPNYFFSYRNFHAEEIKPMIDAIVQRIENKVDVSPKEIFLMEMRRAPIDAWRFAYFYRMPVSDVKRIAAELIEDGVLQAASRENVSDFWGWE